MTRRFSPQEIDELIDYAEGADIRNDPLVADLIDAARQLRLVQTALGVG